MWVAVLVQSLCPDVFEMDDETEKALVILAEGGSEECIDNAIDSCPESCISWESGAVLKTLRLSLEKANLEGKACGSSGASDGAAKRMGEAMTERRIPVVGGQKKTISRRGVYVNFLLTPAI